MRYYLIDFENTAAYGFNGIEKLRKSDKVVIFYSDNSARISVDDLNTVMSSKALVEFVKIDYLGHNALDFNLTMYVGKIIGQFRGKTLEINIISKDAGYDTLKDAPFSYSAKVTIDRHPTILESLPELADHFGIIKKQIVTEQLTAINMEKYADEATKAVAVAKNKSELHAILFSRYKSEGSTIYKAIRPKFEQLKA